MKFVPKEYEVFDEDDVLAGEIYSSPDEVIFKPNGDIYLTQEECEDISKKLYELEEFWNDLR